MYCSDFLESPPLAWKPHTDDKPPHYWLQLHIELTDMRSNDVLV